MRLEKGGGGTVLPTGYGRDVRVQGLWTMTALTAPQIRMMWGLSYESLWIAI